MTIRLYIIPLYHHYVLMVSVISPCDKYGRRAFVVLAACLLFLKGLLEVLKDTSSLPEVRVKLVDDLMGPSDLVDLIMILWENYVILMGFKWDFMGF